MGKEELIKEIKELIEKGEIKACWENHETNVLGITLKDNGEIILEIDDF